MLHRKDEHVDTDKLQPVMLFALGIADTAFARVGQECVVTSAADSVHNPGSKHGQGLAVDIRNNPLDPHAHAQVLEELKRLEKYGFDVVDEGVHATAATTGTHFHIEYDPKPGERGTLFG